MSPSSPFTWQVKLYLIKMLCSLPNSSHHIWFSLFAFCGWAMTSIQLNQCFSKGRPDGSHFYMLFGMTRLQQDSEECVLTEGGAETLLYLLVIHMCPEGKSSELSELQWSIYERSCHFPLTLVLAPVDWNSLCL